MIDENRDRRGNSLENEIHDMFRRIGFKTEVRSKKFGFESDVIASRGDFIILIQAKRYDETQIDIDSLAEEWKIKGEKVGADRILIVITGHKNINENFIRKARQKGVYLWNENYWRKLQNLDTINLSLEIGKSLKIQEVLDYVAKKEKNDLKEIKEKIKEIKDPLIRDKIYEELGEIDFSEDTKRDIQLKKIENKIVLAKEMEIEEQNDKIKQDNENKLKVANEERDLQFVYKDIIKLEDPIRRGVILEELKKVENLSDETKRKLQIEKIKNEILLEKEMEIEDKTEDVELEEAFRKIKESDLDYHRKYLVLGKIKDKINLSPKSKKIVDWEEIDTWIKKQEQDSGIENWGDERYVQLEKLLTEGKLSKEDKEEIQENIKELGLSKKGYTEAEKIKIENIIKKAIFKKKLIKLAISLGIIVIVFVILWGILF